MKSIISKSIFLTIIVIVINFVFKIYLSYHLEKDEIGLFYTSIDVISVASLLFSGYKDSMIKIFSENNFNIINGYIFRQYFIMVVILTPIMYVVFENYHDINLLYPVALFLLYFLISQISNYYSYLNVAHRNYNSMLYEKSIKAVSLVLSFYFLSFFFSPLIALILAYLVQLISHIIYMYITSPHIYFISNNENRKDIYYSFLKNYKIATITSFFGSITIYISAIMMFYLYEDSSTLSEYQVVVKSIFFALIAVFVHPITAYTFPELSKFISQKNYFEVRRLDKKLQFYLFIFFVTVLLSTMLTKFMVELVFPAEYINSYKMLNILLPFLPFIVYTSFAINIIKGFDRFDLALYIRVFGSMIFFISMYILYTFGIDAKSIVYSLALSFFTMFLASFYFKRTLLL